MQSLLEEERKRVDALLRLTQFEFKESEPEIEPSQLGALGGWQFSTGDSMANADVYVFDDRPSLESAMERLMAENKPDATWELPKVGSNGRLVFIVRYSGSPSDSEAAFKVLGIVSALAGEEE